MPSLPTSGESFNSGSPPCARGSLHPIYHLWGVLCQPDNEWSSSKAPSYHLFSQTTPGTNCHRLGYLARRFWNNFSVKRKALEISPCGRGTEEARMGWRRNWAAMQAPWQLPLTPWGTLELQWLFRVVPDCAEMAKPLYAYIDSLVDLGCPKKEHDLWCSVFCNGGQSLKQQWGIGVPYQCSAQLRLEKDRIWAVKTFQGL